MRSNIINKIQDRNYRKAFLRSQINVGLPFQIRALREKRGWTQGKLAEEAQMLQPRVSAMETPGRSKPNLETLLRLANAFDVGLIVRFAPFSEVVRWSENFVPDSFVVPTFQEDTGFIDVNETVVEPAAAVNVEINRSLGISSLTGISAIFSSGYPDNAAIDYELGSDDFIGSSQTRFFTLGASAESQQVIRAKAEVKPEMPEVTFAQNMVVEKVQYKYRELPPLGVRGYYFKPVSAEAENKAA